MSLKINNLATDKQKKILLEHGYTGTGKYVIDNLSIQEAAEIIDGLFEEERLQRQRDEDDFYQQEPTDPFNI